MTKFISAADGHFGKFTELILVLGVHVLLLQYLLELPDEDEVPAVLHVLVKAHNLLDLVLVLGASQVLQQARRYPLRVVLVQGRLLDPILKKGALELDGVQQLLAQVLQPESLLNLLRSKAQFGVILYFLNLQVVVVVLHPVLHGPGVDDGGASETVVRLGQVAFLETDRVLREDSLDHLRRHPVRCDAHDIVKPQVGEVQHQLMRFKLVHHLLNIFVTACDEPPAHHGHIPVEVDFDWGDFFDDGVEGEVLGLQSFCQSQEVLIILNNLKNIDFGVLFVKKRLLFDGGNLLNVVFVKVVVGLVQEGVVGFFYSLPAWKIAWLLLFFCRVLYLGRQQLIAVLELGHFVLILLDDLHIFGVNFIHIAHDIDECDQLRVFPLELTKGFLPLAGFNREQGIKIIVLVQVHGGLSKLDVLGGHLENLCLAVDYLLGLLVHAQLVVVAPQRLNEIDAAAGGRFGRLHQGLAVQSRAQCGVQSQLPRLHSLTPTIQQQINNYYTVQPCLTIQQQPHDHHLTAPMPQLRYPCSTWQLTCEGMTDPNSMVTRLMASLSTQSQQAVISGPYRLSSWPQLEINIREQFQLPLLTTTGLLLQLARMTIFSQPLGTRALPFWNTTRAWMNTLSIYSDIRKEMSSYRVTNYEFFNCVMPSIQISSQLALPPPGCTWLLLLRSRLPRNRILSRGRIRFTIYFSIRLIWNSRFSSRCGYRGTTRVSIVCNVLYFFSTAFFYKGCYCLGCYLLAATTYCLGLSLVSTFYYYLFFSFFFFFYYLAVSTWPWPSASFCFFRACFYFHASVFFFSAY